MESGQSQAYGVDGNVLRFKSGVRVTFEHPIQQVIDFGEVVVVLVLPPIGGPIYNENVFGVRKDGEIVWRVPRFDWVRGDSPYTSIHISEGDHLVRLFNYRCTNIFLDPLTGRFVREEFSH